MPLYSTAFAGTDCAYPCRDGQAELIRVVGYIYIYQMVYLSAVTS